MDEHGESSRAHLILGIASPAHEDGDADGDMSPEEQEMHGEAAMREMWEAMKSGDFKMAFHAMRAVHACTEPDGDEYDHDEMSGEPADEE